jgi:hypothetical protein
MARRRPGLYGFKNFSERGDWVEMLFMAAASFHGYRVLKPWGEVSPYDVAIDANGRLVRVQVKSTSKRGGAGYLCVFSHDRDGRRKRYRAGEVDLFVSYVVPEEVWYIFPAQLVTGPNGTANITVCQFEGVRTPPKYERYREAWELLGKDRSELGQM